MVDDEFAGSIEAVRRSRRGTAECREKGADQFRQVAKNCTAMHNPWTTVDCRSGRWKPVEALVK